MTAFLLRIVIFAVIGIAIYLGARRIWRDWRGEARAMDRLKHERDLRERQRPGIVTLKRDKDGKFRPPEE